MDCKFDRIYQAINVFRCTEKYGAEKSMYVHNVEYIAYHYAAGN